MKTRTPKIGIGLAVFNGEDYLEESMRSLLAQTHKDFVLAVSDNGSTDATPEIIEEMAKSDSRIIGYRFSENQGQIVNWLKSFEIAEAHTGELDYFAFAGHHDLWHPEWLETLLEKIEADSEAVLVNPTAVAIDDSGDRIEHRMPVFETAGLGRFDRTSRAATHMKGAGTHIFGLFRARNLKDRGVYPSCIFPDRLLLMKLAVEGTFLHVPRELFYRRYSHKQPPRSGRNPVHYRESIVRQVNYLWKNKTPFRANFPILTHVIRLIIDLSLKPNAWSRGTVRLGFLMAFKYARRRKWFIREELRNFARHKL